MEDFEKIKEEYNNIINDNKKIVDEMNAIWDSQETGINFYSILDPKNEKELKYAVSFMYITIDIARFMNGIPNGLFNDIKFEDHEALLSVIDAIISLKETGDENVVSPDKMTMTERARFLYGLMLILFVGQINETLLEYTATKSGFDINDYVEVVQFVAYVKGLFEIHRGAKDESSDKKYSELTDKDIEELYDYAIEFHRLFKQDTTKQITK